MDCIKLPFKAASTENGEKNNDDEEFLRRCAFTGKWESRNPLSALYIQNAYCGCFATVIS